MAERWLTYQQIAELYGMSSEAARQLVLRRGWRKQPGNDGRILALVPEDAEVSPRTRTTPDQTPEDTPEQTGGDNALAALLREQLERERERADRAEAQAAAERSRAETAEKEREAARIQAATAEGEGRVLRDRVQAAEDARDAARAELADWTAGGPFARAFRAFLNRRGRP